MVLVPLEKEKKKEIVLVRIRVFLSKTLKYTFVNYLSDVFFF